MIDIKDYFKYFYFLLLWFRNWHFLMIYCLIFFTLICFNYKVLALEYEARGAYCYTSRDLVINSDFEAYYKSGQWFIKCKYSNPLLAILDIEIGYDGTHQYALFNGIIPSNTIANVKISTNIVINNGYINNDIHYGSRSYCGPEIVWMSLCSHMYFSSLTNNMIYPIFDPIIKTVIPANITYIDNTNKFIKSLEYKLREYGNTYELTKYSVLEYTNICSSIIPIKAEASIFHLSKIRDNDNIEKFIYTTGAIYRIFISHISTNCNILDFKPKIKGIAHIVDSRFTGKNEYPPQVFYYTTNWLSDQELTNHPAFITEYKRHKEMKRLSEFIQKRTKYGRIVFFSLLFISTIPVAYLVYKYKIRPRKEITK